MPNMKLYVDARIWAGAAGPLGAALPGLRETLCRLFAVEPVACQVAVLSVLGLEDQPQVNVELTMLPRPDRTREMVTAAAAVIRDEVAAALGTRVAVRIASLEAATYVALK